MAKERFLKLAIKKYFLKLGYNIKLCPIRLGHSEIDGEAIKENERIAIEIKTPNDDIVRGIGQMATALAYGYTKAILVTTRRNGKRIDEKVFKHYGFEVLGVDGWGKIHKLI